MELKEFNLKEYQKITDPAELRKSMFIEASAGTGKTYTITGIIEKLTDSGIKLDKILVVTYTEKAAGELRDRIRKACPKEDVDNAPIYTIHSFCQKTLSEFSFTANQCANLSVTDDSAIDDFICRWIRDVLKKDSTFKQLFEAADKQSTFIDAISKDFKHAVSKYYLDRQNQESKDIVSLDNVYTKITKKDFSHEYTYDECDTLLEETVENLDSLIGQYNLPFGGKTINSIINKINAYKATRFYIEQFRNLYIAWQTEKENKKMQSYDDMLRNVREAVCTPDSNLKKQLQKKYTFAIIDEFQDTNQKQWDTFKTVFMEDADHAIIVVGDPKQSIYAFQGADVNVYKKAVQSIKDNGGIPYKISTNYRSTDKMVKACNYLFKNFFTTESKIEFSESNPSGTKGVALYNGEETPPVWIGGQSFEPVTEEDFAKIAAQTIIDCCTWENGKTKLQVFNKDIKDDKGRYLEPRNVSFRDFAILVRASTEYSEIENALKKAGIPFIRYKDKNLFFGKECQQWISLFNAINAKDFTGHNRAILSEALFTDFFNISIDDVQNEKFDNPSCPERQLIVQWQQLAQQRKWAKLLENIFADTNIENRLSQLDKMQSLTKLRQIGNYVIDYLYKTDCSLEDAALHLLRLSNDSESSMDEGNLVEKGTDFDCVQLMTIHASKGLEFPVVIVPAGLKARNNQVPHAYFYHDENLNAKLSFNKEYKKIVDTEDDYERERIYYVAYTRASSILMLPFYNIWDPQVSKQKAAPHQFLKNNINFLTSMKTKKENLFVRKLKDNKKNYTCLKNEVQIILSELKKKKEKQSVDSDNKDISEDAQLKQTKDLSSKIPSLSIRKHSYSSLSHKKAALDEMTENGGRADKEGSDSQQTSLAAFDMAPNPVSYVAVPGAGGECPSAVPAPEHYPNGTKLGIAIHEVFEKADFGVAEDNEGLRRLITACFEKQTLSIPEDDPDKWLAYTSSLVWNTLNAKLPEISGGEATGNYFKLSELTAADPLSETEFNMNADITGALKNYCNGFIDLVFKRSVGDRDLYSILDWKSNSYEAGQYCDGEFLKGQTDALYSIQRVLYSYSLIKWLATFYPEETESQIYENHFGGIYYAYVRGCHADTCSGIYARTWENWDELEKAYKGILNELINRA